MVINKDISFFENFPIIEPINKGWSNDKKYCVTMNDGTKYLLRILAAKKYERQKILFNISKQLVTLNIPMCEPIELGISDVGVYTIQTWINGDDLEKILPMLTETKQYTLGIQSGKLLKQIHSVHAPIETEKWSIRFNRKLDSKIKQYNECGIKFDGDDLMLKYIEQNRHLLDNRPQCFQHGDYHVGNMILEDHNLKIIDFDRFDFGDPWEEFNRIVWSAGASPYFATGQLKGYFDGEVPLEFFELLALYISNNTISSIPWSIPFGETDVAEMIEQSQLILSWFDNMENPIPTWYLKDFYIQYTDGIAYKLKSSFDFSFLKKYGTVFKVFDDQDSGNICFGVKKNEKKYFIKFAGAPTKQYEGSSKDAISRLKSTISIYKDLSHPTLIKLIETEEIAGGFAAIFEWVDAECMGRMYPLSRQEFMKMPIETKVKVLEDIMDFHIHVHQKNYVAIDFYDASIMYDFKNNKTIICDIDFYAKKPYINKVGKMWGSSRFMSPEENIFDMKIDEITNVYTMAATAFALFSNGNRTQEKWPLSDEKYLVIQKAISDDKKERQQSISQLLKEWKKAL